jgi:hypothetical protein
MKKNKFLIMLMLSAASLFFTFCGSGSSNNASEDSNSETLSEGNLLTKDEVLNMISGLPELKEAGEVVRSQCSGGSIEYLYHEPSGNDPFCTVDAYTDCDGSTTKNNIFTFYVNLKTKEIQVLNPNTKERISYEEWKKSFSESEGVD